MNVLKYTKSLGLSPNELAIVGHAFDAARLQLQIPETNVAINETLAKVIIEDAKAGERDPNRLVQTAIRHLATLVELGNRQV